MYSRKYETGSYIRIIESYNARGRRHQMLHLTEIGLYRYLLQSRLDKAVEFQLFVYKLLRAERKRTVDSVQLALKIAQTQIAEQKKAISDIKIERGMVRQEVGDCMKIANDARIALKKAQAQLTKIKESRRMKDDARIASAEAEASVRCWMTSSRPV